MDLKLVNLSNEVHWGKYPANRCLNSDQRGSEHELVRERICVCAFVMWTAHIQYGSVCEWARAHTHTGMHTHTDTDRQTEAVMQCLRNLFQTSSNEPSVGFSCSNAPFKGIWFAVPTTTNLIPPPPPAMTDWSSDDTQWNVCTIVLFLLPNNVQLVSTIFCHLYTEL